MLNLTIALIREYLFIQLGYNLIYIEYHLQDRVK